jgi:Smg protein
LPAACRGFITFLEQHDAVDAPLREAIIERALALPDAEISLDRLKVIVLAVIWRYRHEVDALILEELLAEDVDDEDSAGGESVTRILLN